MKKIDPFDSRGLDPADFRFGAMPSQGDTENTYQLEVHLSATEYPDVIEYLTQYKGDAREERIKELLRLGFQKSQAQDACTAVIAKASRVANIDLSDKLSVPAGLQNQPARKELSAEESIARLDAPGMDPANFQFGNIGKKS